VKRESTSEVAAELEEISPSAGAKAHDGRGSRSWARRAAELHGELSAIAKPDLRWWLLAGGAAVVEQWGEHGDYVMSDATPTGDTYIGYRTSIPADPIADAIARAMAARTALRELDDQLPEQPLAVTLRVGSMADHNEPPNGSAQPGGAATIVPSALDVAAFVIGNRCAQIALDDPELPRRLAALLDGATPMRVPGPTPFVCVSIGDDHPDVARHGHRRAWRDGVGPWLGLGRCGEGIATVSTCHMVVDGYGHARIAGRIAELGTVPSAEPGAPRRAVLPALSPVSGAIPLGVAWRELPTRPRALPLAYALGRVLHRAAGHRDAKFSPTFQIPIAPGDRSDPLRIRRRVVAGIVSVRFQGGQPEPFEVFAERARNVLAREAAGHGLWTRLVAAARGTPAPLAWKRKSIGATRAPWLDRFAQVIGGRGCLSKIHVDAPLPPSCAVSSPARLATPTDPLGSCVITILEDARRCAITACGSGTLAGTLASADALLDELLALV
jgi:hypothetical protein